LQTALLKKITGEDSLDAEVKGKQKRLSFRNVAKVFVLGNEFPKINDSSVAFQERTLILKFPNSFRGKGQIDNIEQTWLSDPIEVSGIFNWMLAGLHRLWTNNDFSVSKTTQEVMLEFKRTSDPISAWIEDNCIFDPEGFVSRKAAFEDYKNYADQELGKAPETERRFYQRLRDTPRVKNWDSNREGRGFKGLRLKTSEETVPQDVQTQLITAATATTADNFNFQKNPNSAGKKIINEEKPVVPVVEIVPEKDSGGNFGKSNETLIPQEPVHFHVLPPNEPHPCDKYGCAREAKYQLGNGYYCHDKAVSHFTEVANTCQSEGFELVEDQQQFDEPGE
jgi:hypothetical protein